MIKFMCIFLFVTSVFAAELKLGDSAPQFEIKTHENIRFSMASRRGQWTVLYFYPKAETPGCTQQACAFRDNIKKIRDQGADVFGISTDSVKNQAAFHTHHKLNFTLLADEEGQVTELFGSKMPVMKISKRWTFIIDPSLKIRSIDKDVDPAFDSIKVAQKILDFKKEK